MLNKERIKDIGFKNIGLAFVEVISFCLGARSMVIDMFNSFSVNQNTMVFPLIMFIIFAATVIFHISSLSDQITNSTPKIIFGKPYFTKDNRPFMQDDPFLGSAGSGVSFGDVDVLRIDISNMPKNPTEHNYAKSVRAIITYYNSIGKQIGKQSEGRWASREYPESKRAISNVSSIDIKSNGEFQKLDLAIFLLETKNKGDVYIFNNEFLFLGARLTEENNKDFKLDDKETIVHIKLIGVSGKGEQWFEFSFKNKTSEILSEKPKVLNL